MVIGQTVITRRHFEMGHLDMLLTRRLREQPGFFGARDKLVATVMPCAKLRGDRGHAIRGELHLLIGLVDPIIDGHCGRCRAQERIQHRLRGGVSEQMQSTARNWSPFSRNRSFQPHVTANAIATPAIVGRPSAAFVATMTQ